MVEIVEALYEKVVGVVDIFIQTIQAYRLGVTRPEQEDAINVALVVGGSIVIPHMRRVYELLTELYSG